MNHFLTEISDSVSDFSTVHAATIISTNNINEAPNFRVTNIGKQFLYFIASNITQSF